MFNIATAVLKSNGKYDNISRLYLLKIVLQKLEKETDILILPAGFFNYEKLSDKILTELKREIITLLQEISPTCTISLGIDSNDGNDQLGIAINSKEIIAIARKFHPTEYEKGVIKIAKSPNEFEFGKNRIFELKNKKFFIAVCYDSFGIKHKKLKNQNINFVINIIHGFEPKGSGNSGEVYFAKHGMAGASKEWNCPVFSSAVFFDREIPKRWPTAVIWNKGEISTQKWKYDYNPISPNNVFDLQVTYESIQLKSYTVK